MNFGFPTSSGVRNVSYFSLKTASVLVRGTSMDNSPHIIPQPLLSFFTECGRFASVKPFKNIIAKFWTIHLNIPFIICRFMNAYNIQHPSIRTFFRYQKKYLCSVVLRSWTQERTAAISETKTQNNVVVGGDARCDSMGFCAQYGTYSLMNLTSNRLIDIQPVSVSFQL